MLQPRSSLASIEARPPRTRFASVLGPLPPSRSLAPRQHRFSSANTSSLARKDWPYGLSQPSRSTASYTFRKSPQRTRQRTLGRSFVQP
jgi:hypothetical protein